MTRTVTGGAGSAGWAGWAGTIALLAGLIAGSALKAAPLQAQPQTPLQRLEASIQRTTRSINATWGIYVKSLQTGETVAIDADRQMETMSTIKIPLMIEVFEQIKAGSSS